uniref:Uncharacterized protein n=1 Tax=Melanopsichium pennsylvanicum 4 TaxID=1398559 RepID=A0A077R5J5_9BASI|nr:uncharacterized protein BN887_06311 [Melanopsichium pennsylvanicum 4]
MLGVKSNALMIIPSAWAYSNHMLKLVDQMGIALRSVSAAANKSRSGIGIADPSSRRSALRQRNDPNGSGLNRSSSRSFGKRGKDDMQSNPKVYIQPQRRWE